MDVENWRALHKFCFFWLVSLRQRYGSEDFENTPKLTNWNWQQNNKSQFCQELFLQCLTNRWGVTGGNETLCQSAVCAQCFVNLRRRANVPDTQSAQPRMKFASNSSVLKSDNNDKDLWISWRIARNQLCSHCILQVHDGVFGSDRSSFLSGGSWKNEMQIQVWINPTIASHCQFWLKSDLMAQKQHCRPRLPDPDAVHESHEANISTQFAFKIMHFQQNADERVFWGNKGF